VFKKHKVNVGTDVIAPVIYILIGQLSNKSVAPTN
jgi:hypothetical protein